MASFCSRNSSKIKFLALFQKSFLIIYISSLKYIFFQEKAGETESYEIYTRKNEGGKIPSALDSLAPVEGIWKYLSSKRGVLCSRQR